MLKVSSILIAIALIAVSCSNDRAEAQVESQGENPNYKGVEVDTVNPPTMDFEEYHHDFGTITQGDQVRHDFNFTNNGKTPLLIQKAYGSCGCTVPTYPTDPIMPGETGVIEVVFNSKNKEGKQHKRVVVLANTYPEDANVVTISATVEK